MKKYLIFLFLSLIVIIPLLLAMDLPTNKLDTRVQKPTIYIEECPTLEIHEGYVSEKEEIVLVKQGKNTITKVHLSKPMMVVQAEQEEEWGFFQFPNIGKTSDGTLIVSWHMREDSHKAYGQAGRKYTPMMSKDGGKTWRPQDKAYFAPVRGYNGLMKDGLLLQVITPSSKNIKEYSSFPKPIAAWGGRSFYKVDELPQDLQGTYLQFVGESIKSQTIHATLRDSGLVRNAIGELMPVVWWGNIIQMADNSMVAGVYPARYVNEKSGVTRSSVSFYRSTDDGLSWDIIGRIPCEADGILDKRGDNEFDEPTFEVLPDSTFICVMRSGSTSPMYKTFSYDKGYSWTKPEPFTPNGVNPKLMRLGNNVLVLASGRPGVQLRFSLDGDGKTWTEPIEMLPFSYSSFNKDMAFEATCGYANIIADGENSFYIVYSDFKTKNTKGEQRKAIMVRRVEVVKTK